jgi:hypothetical protein
MKKLLFISMIISLCILLPLVGCVGEASHVEIEPTLSVATPSPIKVTLSQSPTGTLSNTATFTPETELASTSTLEPSAKATSIPPTSRPPIPILLQANMSTTSIVCSQVKAYVNIQQETNNESWELMDFVFDSEGVIDFLMWSDRPYPGPTPTPFVGPIEGGGVPPSEFSRSSRVLLKRQTWNFNSGSLVESLVTSQDAILSPCDHDCPLDVISVAPDNSWQLLQITDASDEYQGLWLANQETVTNLIPYVPVDSQWQWSSDSRLLWLIYTLHDKSGESYGSESMVVDLTAPNSPRIVFQSWGENQYQLQSPPNLLSPDDYNLVFSPVEKTVLLYKHIGSSSRIPPDNLLDVYAMDITQNPPQLLNTYEARYPFLIDWSDTLQDFIILELNETGAIIYTLNNDNVYEIPMEVLKQMPEVLGMDGQFRINFSDAVDVISLNINLEGVAISPAKEHVVLMSWNRAWSFSCLD